MALEIWATSSYCLVQGGIHPSVISGTFKAFDFLRQVGMRKSHLHSEKGLAAGEEKKVFSSVAVHKQTPRPKFSVVSGRGLD